MLNCILADATISYLDFGNDETVSHANVQPIPPEFIKFPVQGTPCILDHLSDSLPNGLGEKVLIEGKVLVRLTHDLFYTRQIGNEYHLCALS